ncbi:MAG: hypothetical protein ACC608_09415 [Anaerofustis sp.]
MTDAEMKLINDRLARIELLLTESSVKGMTVNQYAKHSGIGTATIRELMADPDVRLPHIMVGTRAIINVRAADDLITEMSINQKRLRESAS